MVKDLCFEIVEACPNNCKFCSSNSCITKESFINFHDFVRVINYFLDTGGIEELSLSGGEPFLHPDILKMVEYAKSKNIKTVIFTSGVTRKSKPSKELTEYYLLKMKNDIDEIIQHEPWNDRLIENIKRYYLTFIGPTGFGSIPLEVLKKLKDIGLDRIVFDFQGYEAQTDEYLMGRNEQSRQAFLDSMLQAKKAGLDINVHFIPMKPNYKEIGDILELLEIAKIPNISILNFVPQGRGKINREKLQLSTEELNEFFDLLNKWKQNFTGTIKIGIPLKEQNEHKCNAGLEKLDIKFDGTVLPCPAFKELTEEECKMYGIKLFNIYDSLEEIHISGHGTRKLPLCQRVYKK